MNEGRIVSHGSPDSVMGVPNDPWTAAFVGMEAPLGGRISWADEGLAAIAIGGETVYAATTREYRVTAITDGITTIWPDILRAVFDIFGRKLARLMTASEARSELAGPRAPAAGR